VTTERRILTGLYGALMLACGAALLGGLFLCVSWVLDAIAAGAVALGLLALAGSAVLIVTLLALMVFAVESILVAVRGEW